MDRRRFFFWGKMDIVMLPIVCITILAISGIIFLSITAYILGEKLKSKRSKEEQHLNQIIDFFEDSTTRFCARHEDTRLEIMNVTGCRDCFETRKDEFESGRLKKICCSFCTESISQNTFSEELLTIDNSTCKTEYYQMVYCKNVTKNTMDITRTQSIVNIRFGWTNTMAI